MSKEILDILIKYHELQSHSTIAVIVGFGGTTLYCTEQYANLFNLAPSDISGNKLKNIDNQYAQHVSKLSAYYFKMLFKRQPSKVLALFVFNSAVGTKTFLIKLTKYEDIGYEVRFSEIQIDVIGDVILSINYFILNQTNQLPKSLIIRDAKRITTALEDEIVFLLSIGKSYKEISAILSSIYNNESFSDKKIAKIVHNNLFNKFNCFTTQELICIHLSTSSLHTVPTKLLSLSGKLGVLSITLWD